jgi:MFS family permease
MSVIMALGTAVSVAALMLAGNMAAFTVAACCYASFQTGLAATRQALLAAVVDVSARTTVRAYLQSSANAGLAVGAALGGLALEHDTRLVYLAVFALDALSFVGCALLLARVPPTSPRATAGRALTVLRDRPYTLLSFLNMIMLLRMPIISLALPLWIVARTSAPAWMVSALLILNTAAVMLFQVRFARRVTDLASATRIAAMSGAFCLAACAAFAVSGLRAPALADATLLTAGAALLVVGEMMQSSGSWHIGFDLAPDDKQGEYQGLFGTGIPVARMLGPLLLTTLTIGWGVPGWLLLGAAFLASGIATGPVVRWAQASRKAAGPAEPATARSCSPA